MPHRFRITADVAGIGQASDRAQCKLLAAARDHHRRSRLLDRLRLEDRVLDMKISAVKSCSLVRPHREDKPDSLLHLPNAHRWPRREFPTILAVLRLEITGADAKRQPPPADQIDTGGDLGEMRGVAVADRRGEGGETNAVGHRRQRRQDSPAFHERFIGRADAADLDQMVHHREPDEAVVLGPLRLRFHRLERFRRVGTVHP